MRTAACGESNDVSLAGLNHKMGQCITPNCALNFGENGGCTGYLVGEPHRGLEYMFLMMNEARIGVGLAAVGAGYAGYRYSLEYARERTQGRLPDNKDPANKMVPIIRHADVKRMLLAQKAYVEGGLALCLFASRLVDEEKTHPDVEVREESALLLDVLVPIVKAWCSDWCLEANKHAIQILGGYGYTRDFPVERLYRDNRINMIHEGTSGIHGIDLLGRKVMMKNGAGFRLLVRRIQQDTDAAGSIRELVGICRRPQPGPGNRDGYHGSPGRNGGQGRVEQVSCQFIRVPGHARPRGRRLDVVETGRGRPGGTRACKRCRQAVLPGQDAGLPLFLPLGTAENTGAGRTAVGTGYDLPGYAGRGILNI